MRTAFLANCVAKLRSDPYPDYITRFPSASGDEYLLRVQENGIAHKLAYTITAEPAQVIIFAFSSQRILLG